MKVLILLIVLITGCGSEILNKKEIDPLVLDQTMGFVHRCQFEGICNYEYLRLVSVKFTDIETEGTLGTCTIYKNGDRKIILDNSIKGTAYLEIVVYHELAHCLLNLPHYEEELDIMNAYVPSPERYNKNRKELLDKVFKRGKQNSFMPWKIGKILQKNHPHNCNHTH